MAYYYTTSEIKEVLTRLSQQPASGINYVKFERLGISVDLEVDSSSTDDNNQVQLYACSVCKKKLISAHLLDLHVAENHDSYFDLQKDKKPMFSCYLEECKHMSASPEERKDHCIKVHKFPHDFRFDKVTNHKKSSSKERMDTTEEVNVNSKPSVVKPKLTHFHFGHKSQKAFVKSHKKTNPLETMNVDMKESLPDV